MVAPGQGEPEPKPGIPEFWETTHRVRLGKYLSGTKCIPTLGPGPVLNMTNFIFRESLRNILRDLFLLLFGFWGYVGGIFCYFFKLQNGCFSPSASKYGRAGMDGLVIHFP